MIEYLLDDLAPIREIDRIYLGRQQPDQPGRLIQCLYPRVPVYTWTVPGIWYDIGSKETLDEANRIFSTK